MKAIARLVTVAALAALSLTAVDSACAETKIRFSLDWIPGSVHSPFFIALYKGYYQAEGLDVVIDRGKGSVGLVQQMASGVYDLGYPDINLLTNNPAKVEALRAEGVEVIEQLPLIVTPSPYNKRYLATKKERMAHKL